MDMCKFIANEQIVLFVSISDAYVLIMYASL